MIVLNDERLVLMTPPKTASSALHVHCCQTHNGIHICGETDGCFDHHTTRVPDAFRDYAKVVVVRHPLDRLVSLWHHLVRWNANHGDGCCSFADFCELVNSPPDKFHWIYHRTICEYLRAQPVDGVLHYESLLGDLNRLTGWNDDALPVVHEQISFRSPWRSYFTDVRAKAAALRWAAADMVRFEYEAEL